MTQHDYFAKGVDEVHRTSPDQVFSIIFDTHPDASNEIACAGAVALCWVDTDTLLEAERIAVDRLIADGWQPVSFEEYRIVSAESDRYGQEGYSDAEIEEILGNVAMAQRDGFFARYYAYPADDSEH